MGLLSSFLNGVFYLLHGKWVVTSHISPLKNSRILTSNINGYYVEFYCQDIIYIQHFSHWYIPNKTIRTFKYSTVVDEKAPDDVKEKCKQTVYFPDFSPRYLGIKEKKKHMLNVYLDIVNLKISK